MLALPDKEGLVELVLDALLGAEPGISVDTLMDGRYDRLPAGGGIYLIGVQLDAYEGSPLGAVENWTARRAAFYVGESNDFRARFAEHAMKLAAITEEAREEHAGAAVDLTSFFMVCVETEPADRLALEGLAIEALRPLANGGFGGKWRVDPDYAWTLVGRCKRDAIPDEVEAAASNSEPSFAARYPNVAARLSERYADH